MVYVLPSGNIAVGNNTPTGAKFQFAVDNPYIEKEMFINSFEARGIGLTKDDPSYSDGTLDRMLLSVSAAINRYCSRWFDQQTIDEQTTGFQVRPYNPQLITVVLQNRPYSKLNSIYIQVLKWFIQIDTSATGYVQDFYTIGMDKIVPMLSTAGTGLGSPLPAAIVDRVPLGVLWTNYTFGFGTPLTAQTLPAVGNSTSKKYQAAIGNRLWAPSQTTVIYDNGAVVAAANYTIDYPNGAVTFITGYTVAGTITADFTTNESLPAEIKQAAILLAAHYIGQALQNPLGAASMNIQTFGVNFGSSRKDGRGQSKVDERAKELLEPYVNKMPTIIGF